MKKHLIATVFASLLISTTAMAEGAYGGLSFGVLENDFDGGENIQTGNMGIVLGNINEYGWGYEFFYSLTVVDDSESAGDTHIDWETDTIALYAVFQTKGDVYFKAKGGYSMVSRHFDIESGDNSDSGSDTDDGFSVGLAIGANIGDGAIELSYYHFPDIEGFSADNDTIQGTAFENDSFDSDVQMINLAYVWTF